MTEITDPLAETRERVATILERLGRPADAATILAVSKQQAAAAIRAAHAGGQRDFGENYLQEALPKIAALADLDIRWHFIGRIQSNKTRPIAENFHRVHTVDRLKVAQRLDEHRPAGLGPLQVLLQVNVSAEAQKGGVAPGETLELARAIAALPRLDLVGLMTLPAATGDPAAGFGRLATLRAELEAEGLELPELSMGMSADYERALAAGSTCIRLGTALFGPRES